MSFIEAVIPSPVIIVHNNLSSWCFAGLDMLPELFQLLEFQVGGFFLRYMFKTKIETQRSLGS